MMNRPMCSVVAYSRNSTNTPVHMHAHGQNLFLHNIVAHITNKILTNKIRIVYLIIIEPNLGILHGPERVR